LYGTLTAHAKRGSKKEATETEATEMDTDTLIQERDGELFVGQSRALVWVIAAHERGETPEQIQANFPTISLDQVRGVSEYYAEHQAELDVRFAEDERRFNEWYAGCRTANAAIFDAMHDRFESARKRRRERAAQEDEVAKA
jgi:uncharacterized protein (DUF433 family)